MPLIQFLLAPPSKKALNLFHPGVSSLCFPFTSESAPLYHLLCVLVSRESHDVVSKKKKVFDVTTYSELFLKPVRFCFDRVPVLFQQLSPLIVFLNETFQACSFNLTDSTLLLTFLETLVDGLSLKILSDAVFQLVFLFDRLL